MSERYNTFLKLIRDVNKLRMEQNEMTINQFKDLTKAQLEMQNLYNNLSNGQNGTQQQSSNQQPEPEPLNEELNDDEFECPEIDQTDPIAQRLKNNSAILCDRIRNNILAHKQVFKQMHEIHKMQLDFYREMKDLFPPYKISKD